jgi:3-phosphoshikimate 1-carboxyvinyltransferase
VELDVSQCPDLVPPLAAHAALRKPGAVTHIVGAARLRIKESDRLASVTQVLNALGAQVEEGQDYLTITAVEQLHGGTVSSYNDHRIAMMAAIAATRATQPVTVLGAECVRKSYPNFWEDYERLGGLIRREEEA